jgi:hypothetical protein
MKKKTNTRVAWRFYLLREIWIEQVIVFDNFSSTFPSHQSGSERASAGSRYSKQKILIIPVVSQWSQDASFGTCHLSEFSENQSGMTAEVAFVAAGCLFPASDSLPRWLMKIQTF